MADLDLFKAVSQLQICLGCQQVAINLHGLQPLGCYALCVRQPAAHLKTTNFS